MVGWRAHSPLTRGAALAAAAFVVQFAVVGTLGRPFRPSAGWALATVASLALGVAAVVVARARPLRVAVALVWSGVITFEVLYFERYHLTFDAHAAACAVRTWTDIREAVRDALPRWGLFTLVGGAGEFVLLTWIHRGVRPIRRRVVFAAVALAATLGAVVRERTPEIELVYAAFRAGRPPEAIALPDISLPVMTPTRTTLPNTLFILTESVRASDYCTAPGTPCPTAPLVNELLSARIPLGYMRSVGSYTSIALSGLYTGTHQLRSRERVLETPTLFDYLRALKTPDGTTLRTHYLSAHLRFYLMGRELAAHTVVRREDLTGNAEGELPPQARKGGDGLLVDRFRAELPRLGEHHFVLLHFEGTHVRYFIDPDDAPFQPQVEYVSRTEMGALHNRYKDAIHEQDKRVADAARAWIAAQGARPWIIVFTSDHGEAFDEHQGIHHGQSLHAEQAHVPAFLVSGNGALDERQLTALRAYGDAPVTHLDLLPTILDAYGLYDALAFAPYRAKLDGRSLLRARAAMNVLPISNCPEWFECPIANWGVQREDLILVANYWSDRWNCASVVTRAEHLVSPACSELETLSRGYYPTLPNRQPNHPGR